MPVDSPYLSALKRGGFRITDQRRAVCEFLEQTTTHPTPSEVFAAVSVVHPDLSRATVYNTLNALAIWAPSWRSAWEETIPTMISTQNRTLT